MCQCDSWRLCSALLRSVSRSTGAVSAALLLLAAAAGSGISLQYQLIGK